LFATTSLQATIVMQGEERLGPWTSKGELTNRVVDLAKPLREGVARRCAMQGTKEAQMIRKIEWMKFAIGPKDVRLITDQKVIK
jgi:hypothetical protein